jgi:hypothetical protein
MLPAKVCSCLIEHQLTFEWPFLSMMLSFNIGQEMGSNEYIQKQSGRINRESCFARVKIFQSYYYHLLQLVQCVSFLVGKWPFLWIVTFLLRIW